MKAIDPVCLMEVDTEGATITSDYQGQTYYFCSTGCKRDFESNPARYIPAADAPGSHPADSGGHS